MVWFYYYYYYYYYYFTQRFTHVRKVDERVKPQGFLVLFFFVYSLIWWTKPMSPCTQLLHFFFLPIVIYTSFLAFFFFLSLLL